MTGELHFENDYRLAIRERIVFHQVRIQIEGYGYETWHGQEKICWYDSQPHPGESLLQ
ncbi:MAG: DUF6516 family protein, partial [Desulfovibrionales bacterium]|nr:DUF6516 family protein [Desulfovibrionales bacterium]